MLAILATRTLQLLQLTERIAAFKQNIRRADRRIRCVNTAEDDPSANTTRKDIMPVLCRISTPERCLSRSKLDCNALKQYIER